MAKKYSGHPDLNIKYIQLMACWSIDRTGQKNLEKTLAIKNQRSILAFAAIIGRPLYYSVTMQNDLQHSMFPSS